MHALHFLIITLSLLSNPKTSTSHLESFIYAGCSQLRFQPGTVYESNLNSVLASLVNSASNSNFNNFKISLPGSTQNDIVYGLFQCRGDFSTADCHHCVASAVTRVGTYCNGATGGAVQLEGCFVKYDNTNFLGVEDKSVASSKCGPSVGYSDQLRQRDTVLAYLTGSGQYFRAGGAGKLQGMVQCVQDLSMSECQDCLNEAIGRLRSECGSSTWGDMFLGKCYARWSERGYTSRSANDDAEKTLAIIIGLIAAVAILVIFLSLLGKSCQKKGNK